MAASCTLAHDPFDPAEELRLFSADAAGMGAIASFTGVARPEAANGSAVHSMFLDHHPRMTQRSIEEIAGDAAGRFDIVDTLIIHRCGTIEPNEPIVFVAASSRHRRAALQAVDYMMDRLKTEAFFWKREQRDSGAHWIEPTDTDYQDKERWAS